MADEQIATIAELSLETGGIEISNKLQGVFLDGILPKQENSTNTQEAAKAADPVIEHKPLETEEILEPAAYLKTKFGWDSEEVAQQELKDLREKATKPFEYKNDESKKLAEYINDGKIDDLYSFLDTKKKLDKLSTADLSDKNIAAELVKFGIQKDNPTLNPDEVEFLFSEKYSLPEKPTQTDEEPDLDYQSRMNAWQAQVNNIEKRLVIEAKMQQPKMAQLKTELVLPEIKRENQIQSKQPTSEELAAFTKERDNFLQNAQQTINGFNGFNVQVKDKDVDYTVSYTPSNEEKTLVDNKLKQFAASGFDANALLAERWVAEDGKTLKVEQMVKDLSKIYTDEKMLQKMVTDSGNKRLEAYLKEKKQPAINATRQSGTLTLDSPKQGQEALTESWLKM